MEKSLQELPVVGNKSLNAIDLSAITPKPDENNEAIHDANIAKQQELNSREQRLLQIENHLNNLLTSATAANSNKVNDGGY